MTSVEKFKLKVENNYSVNIITYNTKTEKFVIEYKGRGEIEKLMKHFETNKKIAVYSTHHQNYTMYTKNFLTIGNDQIVKEVVDIFRSDIEYWRKNFINFDKEHYPEYFL